MSWFQFAVMPRLNLAATTHNKAPTPPLHFPSRASLSLPPGCPESSSQRHCSGHRPQTIPTEPCHLLPPRAPEHTHHSLTHLSIPAVQPRAPQNLGFDKLRAPPPFTDTPAISTGNLRSPQHPSMMLPSSLEQHASNRTTRLS